MADPNDDTLEVPIGENMPQPEIAESGNMTIAMTAMANEFGAAAARRAGRFDQLGADAAAMWSVAMTTPTNFAAYAMRVANESGHGRTRAETNLPSATSASGNG